MNQWQKLIAGTVGLACAFLVLLGTVGGFWPLLVWAVLLLIPA